MRKKVVILLVISLFLIGCTGEECIDVLTGECLSNADCDDEKINTIDRCEGEPLACVHEFKTCDEIYGIICGEDEVCTDELVTSDEEHCCVGLCSEKQEDVEIELKTCAELKGYICESLSGCPKDILKSSDSLACCPVKCMEGKVIYFLNKEIDGYLPIDLGKNTPKIFFSDDLDEGYQMTYEKDGDLIEVSVWVFDSSDNINEDLESYMEDIIGSKNSAFMEIIYEDYEVIGIQELDSAAASYIWYDWKKVIMISESDSYHFLDAYIDKYSSDFETDYFD
ncbi:hypothetical protein GOV06_03565 [Candidatus Woesearchaeota archaeon]|nr:hypothetical protein [Candidatus Woesearchaeota archaeon]